MRPVGSGADHAGTVGGTGRNRIFIRFHYSKENWDQILELDNRFHEWYMKHAQAKN